MEFEKPYADKVEVKNAKEALSSCFFQKLVEKQKVNEVKLDFLPSDHFILGIRSPFLARVGVEQQNDQKENTTHIVAAVYVLSFGTNGMKAVHGGAISAIFDWLMAIGGILSRKKPCFGATKELNVKYKRFTPLNDVLRVEFDISFDDVNGFAQAEGFLCDQDDISKVYAESSAVLADTRLRSKLREQNKNISKL